MPDDKKPSPAETIRQLGNRQENGRGTEKGSYQHDTPRETTNEDRPKPKR